MQPIAQVKEIIFTNITIFEPKIVISMPIKIWIIRKKLRMTILECLQHLSPPHVTISKILFQIHKKPSFSPTYPSIYDILNPVAPSPPRKKFLNVENFLLHLHS